MFDEAFKDFDKAFKKMDEAFVKFDGKVFTEALSFRDQCAKEALSVWVQAHIDQSVDDLDKATIAQECFSYADAMEAERQRRNKDKK